MSIKALAQNIEWKPEFSSGKGMPLEHFHDDANLMLYQEDMIPPIVKMGFHILSIIDQKEKVYNYDYEKCYATNVQEILF